MIFGSVLIAPDRGLWAPARTTSVTRLVRTQGFLNYRPHCEPLGIKFTVGRQVVSYPAEKLCYFLFACSPVLAFIHSNVQ